MIVQIAEGVIGEDARKRPELGLPRPALAELRGCVTTRGRFLALRVKKRRQLRLGERAEQPSHVVDLLGAHLLSFEPRLFRILRQKLEASMSCTLPLRGAGLRLETIHT